MPPINQQSSRAGLITALVIFAILFVVSTVFAINFYGKFQQVAVNYDTYQKKYNQVLNEAAVQSAPVQALQAAKGDNKLGVTSTDTVVDILFKQTAALANSIGAPTDQKPSDVVDGADLVLKDNQTKLKAANVTVTLPATGGLESAISALTDGLVAEQANVVRLTAQLKDANTKIDAGQKDIATVNTQSDEKAKAAADAATAALAQVNQSLDANKATIAQMQADQTAHDAKNTDDANKSAAELTASNAENTKKEKAIAALQVRLGKRRANVTDAALRQADGKIVRVPNTSVCYINLGNGDQVTAGLTFEVYDKIEGVPGLPESVTGDEQLPVGKASIEITHVGDTSSECRIVKIQPGAIISEGDLIANLVYDPHTKYNFFVFGNFDLAGNGRPNANDANFIKQLVTQWGGKLIDKVNPDTDFVVLGAEPVLPTFSKEDETPENAEKRRAAQEALDKYQEVSQQAKDLHIPVLNQNRFLYYVGYYDQAKR